MPWCPKCKNEYREGFTVCADCGVTLVSSFEEANEILFATGTMKNVQDLKNFLEKGDIHCQIRENTNPENTDTLYDIVIQSKDEKKAVQALRLLAAQAALKAQKPSDKDSGDDEVKQGTGEDSEAVELSNETRYTESRETLGPSMDQKEESGETEDCFDPGCEPELSGGVYHTKSYKAKEFRSSAWVMLIVGIAGLILVGLIQFGVVDIDLGNLTMLKIVTSIMFVIFIIVGIKSFSSAKKYDQEAVEEKELTDTICKWCDENLTKEKIDEGIDTDHVPEEMLYFPRTTKMKKMISKVYLNVNPTLLDHIVEQYYKKIYEEEE